VHVLHVLAQFSDERLVLAVTIRVCPSGCVCHAVRAPGSNVTLAPLTRAGSGALNSGSMRTVPVNHSAGPLPEGWVPFRLISMALLSFVGDCVGRDVEPRRPLRVAIIGMHL
jgi:hypothetical protein